MKVIVQKWEESERGWGERPDGYSIHRTEEHRALFVQNIYKKRDPDDVPDEYERIAGTPYECEIDDDDKRIQDLLATDKYGIRVNNNDYPGSGGTDGWVPRREP